jgi:hypothetical protein
MLKIFHKQCNSKWHISSQLLCGRCEKKICPDCLIHTPGGTRCRTCAEMRKSPVYELKLSHYFAAIGSNILIAPIIGYAMYLFVPILGISFISMIIAFLLGVAIGTLNATIISKVTRGKKGKSLQLIAVVFILGTVFVRYLLVDFDQRIIETDFISPLASFIACIYAWQRLD